MGFTGGRPEYTLPFACHPGSVRPLVSGQLPLNAPAMSSSIRFVAVPALALGFGLSLIPGTMGAQVPAPAGGVAAHADAPIMRATATAGAMRIDGVLDEAGWERATPVTGFRQRDPDEGAPVSQPTIVRVLHDADALYIGARLDDASGVTSRLGRRDMALLNSDWLAISIDSYHDHRTAFRFQVNPHGVQRDATVSTTAEGEDEDASWDAVWEVETAVTGQGWVAEVRIPFSQLRFRPQSDATWGIQIERIIGRRGEVAHFAFVPKRELMGVPRYGHLEGLQGIVASERLEVTPYVAARAEHVDPGENPFRSDREQHASVGADVLYRLTSNFTLNATFNPDFGQVEADPAVINLGVYETVFPERRPFFIEGSQIFGFTGNTSGGSLFYSRRIGRRPQLGPGTSQADIPEASTILGAVKVSGRTSDGWSLGVLNATTARETVRFVDASGTRQSLIGEPLTNYFIARGRRDLSGGRSAIGGAITSVRRDLSNVALERFFRSSAVTGGIDFRHEWSEASWLLTGTAAATHVRGSEASIIALQRQSHHFFQRPDATHLGVDTTTSLSGYSAGLNLTKQAGEHWTGSLAGALTAPGFEANDLGYANRTDRRDVQAVLTYREDTPGAFLRRWNVTAVGRSETNYDGDAIQNFARLIGSALHLDYWGAEVALVLARRAFDDRSTRGGPIIIRPGEVGVAVELFSDQRRAITGELEASVEDTEFGGHSMELSGSIAVRTSPWWNIELTPAFSRGRVAAQYRGTVADADATATFGNRYFFAPLDFTQLDMTVRANVTFAPRMTLEVYAQPLVFTSDYLTTEALVAPRTFSFEAAPGAPAGSGDNTERSLRGNAVLRWEWRPGSAIYLAWQQTRYAVDEESRFDFGRDRRLLFGAPPDNIFLLKASYWLSM